MNKTTKTIKIYEYRYVWQDNNKQMYAKYIKGTLEEHEAFIKNIKNNESVVACNREYICEVDFALIGISESIKEEENKNEKV